ncbi:sensor histidine kinase [Microbulbifer variabilis]|uniref:sensor histidine kinase n=1 Tax=Microbulbifer variabilis TaxID=266805 RepID=UPI001CFE82EF|nr:HAMP domain-containing sensor histidine kinase [Microbulbifer variabilis]
MKIKQPLRERIVIAFVLMTLFVSGTFSIGIIETVHLVEEHLVSDKMRSELLIAMDELGTGQPLQLSKDSQVFSDVSPQTSPPEEFSQIEEGFSEVVKGEKAYYAFKLSRDGITYLLVQDQSEFESREQILFEVVLICFIASLMVAWGLGSLLANRVMRPVTQLADEVLLGTRNENNRPLASNYADDEVGRLAEIFDKTFERLNRSLEREKLFTSDVSHELRTPLMVIGTSCELLAQNKALGEKQSTLLSRIQRASAEMLELVETLLMLARERNVGLEPTRRQTLVEVADQQNDIWRDQFSERGIDYNCAVETVDSGQYPAIFLRTVMSNLLRNSLHYTDEGHVHLVLFNGGFRVEDTGPGIAPEQQSQIFQPFHRGSQVRGEGLGLGLSLVKRICDHEGWTVSMMPSRSRGCVFCVKLAPD